MDVLDPDRPVAVDAANLVLDVVLDVERDVEPVPVADALRDADEVDRFAKVAFPAVALLGFDAACPCADLRCAAVFETDCFDAGAFAVVLDEAFCAARFPAARSVSVIARFETCKRSV